jgi:hypothetical protein
MLFNIDQVKGNNISLGVWIQSNRKQTLFIISSPTSPVSRLVLASDLEQNLIVMVQLPNTHLRASQPSPRRGP